MKTLFAWICGVGLITSHQFIDRFESQCQNPAVFRLMEDAADQRIVMREGTDAQMRPLFVGAQAEFEKIFAQLLARRNLVQKVRVIIHTPAPPTPLCTDGEISDRLADPSILNDPERLATITKRADIVRSLLASGAEITCAYPAGGRNARSAEQLEIFDRLQEQYPHLRVTELKSAIPQELIGATYWITLDTGQCFIFSIMSSQVNAPMDGQWGIWFGDNRDPAIKSRVQQITAFLEQAGGST